MAENKFIKQLRGEQTAKSVAEIHNESAKTTFANMPIGTSNSTVTYTDYRGDATGVLKGTDNWNLSNSSLLDATSVKGDGQDFTGSYLASGSTLWVNATYTFATEKRFTPYTKFVLKLCGHNLLSETSHTVDFSLIIKFGTTVVISKNFTVDEQACEFCKEFVVDFAESEPTLIKAPASSTMTVQLLCGDATASATIYNGMSVFTALQRRVDGDAVSSNTRTFDELEEDFDDLKEDYDQFVIDTQTALDGKVNIDGTSIMTAPLKFASGSMRGAVGPYLNGVSFWKMDSQYTITNIANLTDSRFLPVTTNSIDLGRSANTWKDLYLGGKAYVATLNNGADLTVPNKTGTLATMGDVELAARSGRMLTDQGVWYAKMYSATVPPAAENGTNYADFSQVDVDNNPIIVIYERQSGAWVQTETITPPAEYDGYVPITSKIWDIAEQSGQQGGRILWNHISKEFTPYPTIISFEDIEITGSSTVIMPNDPSANQIVNKDYVDNSIGNGTITLTQGGTTKGTFTVNQSGNTTIDLDAGGVGGCSLFDWKWVDHELDDVSWLRADTFSWQSGSVYQAAYKHLRNDMYNWYSWENNGTTIYTKKAYPEVGEKVYSDSALTTEFGEITDVTDTLDITVEKITVNGVVYDSVSGSNISPTTETVGGVTVQYIPAEDGHKIVTDFHESEVADVYTATGVAWYYIIDYGFKRFKLPRTKFGVTGLRDTVGNYVAPGVPNITATSSSNAVFKGGGGTLSGAFIMRDGANEGVYGSGGGTYFGVDFDASLSNSIYGNSTTVQPPATQMYLYFYVGNFTQSAIENTAGINTEDFNNKVDTDFGNTNMIDYVVAKQEPNAGNGYTWYRKYKSGWVEQGGIYTISSSSFANFNLIVPMSDTNYTITGNSADTTSAAYPLNFNQPGFTTTTFSAKTGNSGSGKFIWRAEGVAA